MKKTLKQFKQHLDFLEDHKYIVGLSDWTIKINTKELETGSIMARVDPDIFEQEFKVYLSQRFLDATRAEQENILLHELLHGRLLIYQIQAQKASEILEEQLINDITRGIDQIRK